MDRFQGVGETILWFILMGVFSLLQSGLSKPEKWNVWKALGKFFVNVVAGVGFYSFLLSYKSWFGDYPQKIGVIMLATYIGSRLIDLLVDKSFDALKKMDIKEFIKHMLKL